MKYRSGILKLALFATGLSGIVAEYVLSTLATYFIGDSVFQWTMIVSIMLFSMGLGSRISKYLENNLILKFIAIEYTLSILSAFVSVFAYLASAYYGDSSLLIYGMSVLIGLLIGLEIPLVIRLNNEYEELRINVSSVMENDYYGSLVGGMFFAFIGLPYLGLTYTPFILGSINFLVACSLVYMLYDQLNVVFRRKLILTTSAVVLVLLAGVWFANDIIAFGENMRYRDKVVYSEQSKYQKIVITQSRGHFFLFINSNQQLSSLDEEMYHEPLVHPAMKLAGMPKNVLILGGGDGGAIREILKYPSVEKMVLVDLDPAMTNLGREHPLLTGMNKNAMNSELLEIINMDGFIYLEETNDFFDAIIIDLPDPKTIELGRLYSYEFYRLCYKRLRPRGVLITQAGSPYYAARAFHCIEKTMGEADFATLPLHNQVLTLGEWGWILGAKGIKQDSLKPIAQRLSFDGLDTRFVNNESMTLMTSFGKQVFMDENDPVEVNRIHHPVLYKYYLNGDWDLY